MKQKENLLKWIEQAEESIMMTTGETFSLNDDRIIEKLEKCSKKGLKLKL